MNKNILLLIVSAIVLVGLLIVISLIPGKPIVSEKGIIVDSIERQDNVFTDIKIKGKINGDGWIAFEGQAGVVKFLDKDDKSLGYSLLIVVGEWMVPPPINFEASIRMTPEEADSVAKLEFTNENPSGDPTKDKKFVLPVKIEASGEETSLVKVYFMKNSDSEADCRPSSFVSRIIPKTQAVARAALEELFKGPTVLDSNDGFSTVINPGVKINSLTIDDKGLAKADFSQELESTGGSCRVTAIRAQITQTLKQFPTIKNVIISIDGRTEDILQP